MRKLAVAVLLMACASAATAQEKQAGAPPLETRVRKLWQSFKDKDKAALSSVIDDHFRMFEEGLSAFADKKAEVNAVDEFELVSYTLSDFTVKSIAGNAIGSDI